jgi:CzcA family heavy metal efflux pump
MLTAIVSFSLRFRGVVLALAVALLGYGLYTLSHARYDVFPDFAPPQAVVQTEAPGLSPEQVESLVTQPVENALNGVEGLQSLRSSSIQGLSVVTVVFKPDADLYRGRQSVVERLSTLAGTLPQGAGTPVLMPLTSATSTVLIVGITSGRRSLMDQRTLADWTLKPRLLAVPGVAKVAVYGGDVRQIQVQVLPATLIAYGLSLQEVLEATRRATGVQGAGFIEGTGQRVGILAEGQAVTASELAKSVLRVRDSGLLTLGDVARVVEAPAPSFGAALINGTPGVLLIVSAQYGTNTLEVTRRVDDALQDLRPALKAEGVDLHADLFRPAAFVETAIHNVATSLLLGGVLVALVLTLFLFNFRSAAISLTAIPLSLLAAITVLQAAGASLNTMTLGGLAIAIGEVVDDAVIDVENILRRLRANRLSPRPRPAHEVVLGASIEVRGAVVYATFAVALVFLPILTMGGLTGRLFAPLGFAYILATLASLLVALAVTPAMSLLFLNREEVLARESPLVPWLKARYGRLLRWVEPRSNGVVLCAALATAGGLAMLPFLGGGLLPELREGHLIVHMTAAPGTSLPQSLELGRQVTRELRKIAGVRSVAQHVGRTDEGDDTLGPQSSEFEVNLGPMGEDQAEHLQQDIRGALSHIVGASFAINTFLTERVEETLSGFTAPVAVSIFGDDLGVLDQKAKEVARVLQSLPGAKDVQIQSPPGTPQLVVRLRRADLLSWGLTAGDVMDAVHAAYQGAAAAEVYEGNKVTEVTVILSPESRKSPAQVASLPIRTTRGPFVFLGQVADVQELAGRYMVLHEGAKRVQTVTCGLQKGDAEAFVQRARNAIAREVSLPAGTYFTFAGTAQELARSRQDLMAHSLLAALGILLLLGVVMGHPKNLLLVMANLPFALVGGVVVVFVQGGVLSIGSLVGLVTLFGITLRNSIMMISHYEHLVTREGAQWGLETAIRGASERLSPILMTALVTALGLLPMALGSGAPGREIEGPMALVILGGLATSTILNLLVLPTLSLRFFHTAGN